MNDKECHYDDLAFAEACLILNTNDEDYNATLYTLSSDCDLCPFIKVAWIEQGRNTSIKLNTATAVTWRVYNDSGIKEFKSATDESGIICQFQPNLGEYGIFELIIDDEGCEFDTIVEPSNCYITFAIIFGVVLCVLFGFSIVRSSVNCARKKYQEGKADDNVNEEEPAIRRILSIDTFRGICIMPMIFVTNDGAGYAFLEHSIWNGLSITDLIFPSFLWIMGFCIPISLSSQLAKGVPRLSICKIILRRSILLFLVGVSDARGKFPADLASLVGVSINSLDTAADLENIRIFGVLQRLGVAYFVVGILYTLMSRREEKRYENPTLSKTGDFLSLLPQWIVILIIVVLHCGITFFLPVPGCLTGYLGPGGRHDHGKYFNCTGGAAGYIDRIILGQNHISRYPTIVQVYGSGPFDPEGILGCLTSIFQTFLGVQAGKILKVHRGWKNCIVRWLLLALFCGCLGATLHFTDVIPVNKSLWSLSFVLSTTSIGLAVLIICYLLIDVTSIWRGGPFRIPGMNALVMYIGHHICHQMFPFRWTYGEMKNSHTWRTIVALWDTTMWTIIGYILHRKKIYISL